MNIAKRKTPIRIFLLLSVCHMLCACQADSSKKSGQEQDNLPDSQINLQAYLPIVAGSDAENASFSLIYLDSDAVPELVIFDRYYSNYSVYTIKNDSAVCLLDSMTTVEMSYFEKQNMISTFFRWNGGGDEGGYANRYYQLDQYSETLTDDSIPSFEFIYNAVYDKNGEWTGQGITEHYEKGKKIDAAAYEQAFADLNISQDDPVSCFSENLQRFTKEELQAYLNQGIPVK